jgi:hypothetical protein
MREDYPDETVESIISGTTFYEGISSYDLYLRSNLGFLAMTASDSLVGFGVMPAGVDEMYPPVRDAETRFMDYPKGVGFRVTNAPTAMIQPSRRGAQPAISAVEIIGLDESAIADIRYPETMTNHLGGIIKHLTLLGQQKIQGHAAALNRVEQPYDGYPAAQVNVPPTWLDEQKYVRHLRHAMEPNMLFIRGQEVLIRRIGDVNLRNLVAAAKTTSKG